METTTRDSAGPGFGRRLFLKTIALIALLPGLPSPARAFLEERFPVRTVEKETFRFDPAKGSLMSTSGKKETPYVLTVDGLVRTPLKLSYKDLRALPLITQTSDFHCVEGWSVHDVKWGGFRFSEIQRQAQPLPEAGHALFHSLGETTGRPGGQSHYIESFSLKDLLDSQAECLLALDMDGKPLTHDHGAPLRVVAPYSLGYKNIKYVTRIEFIRDARPGWWTLANPIYPSVAPVPAHRLRKKKT